MIDPRDILSILNDMTKRSASTDLMAAVYEKLSDGNLPKNIQKQALEIIAGQKVIEQVIHEKDVQDFILNATGQFSIVDVARWFDAKGEDKRRIGEIVRQMAADNLIATAGYRNGVYRLVDKDPHIMDLNAPEIDPIRVELPFLLHDLVTLYPKNVILVSGEKDAGKTAFAMNAAWMNRENWNVHYFNSEMGIEELRGRLAKFNYEKAEWSKITWHEQANQFEDHIDPNGLNIIDFLEVGAEAFIVTEDIKRVFDKLEKGLLLIVMQKRSYKEYAVGGEGTLEKARLAINLEHKDGENLARITVAKNWHGTDNPKWKVCKYKVFSGGVMKMDKYWEDADRSETSGAKAPKGFTRKKAQGYDLGKPDPEFVHEE